MLCVRIVRGLCAGVLLAGAVLSVDGQATERVQPMARDAHPSFEVASIKLSDPTDTHHRFGIEGRRIIVRNQTVKGMIEVSYGVHARQIVNAPSWVETERFDVQGVPDAEGQPNIVQLQEMMQKLLASRFGLKMHTEKREMPRYTLAVAKGGPKLAPTKSGPDALANSNGSGDRDTMTYLMTDVSMPDLAQTLQVELDRPVVDETGLKGRYDLSLKWTRFNAPADADTSVPGFFTAIQEQLGLKMEPEKGEVDAMVIDQVKRPQMD